MSSVGVPPKANGLEREEGTVLDVFWSAEGETYRGQVEKVDGMILIYYPCDRKRKWHDFDKDECSFTIVEPPAKKLTKIRRTNVGYDALVDPTGRWYKMDPKYLEKHFSENGESEFIQNLGWKWESVPIGIRRKKNIPTLKKEEQNEPYCVLGSLIKAFYHEGYTFSAVEAEYDRVESLRNKDRLKFAAVKAASYGFQTERIHVHPLQLVTEYPTLLHVARCHVVTICKGLIFDYLEGEPLLLTRANLDRCIGSSFQDAVVRGYKFIPHNNVKKAKDGGRIFIPKSRKRLRRESE